jgi:hypothetical protein
VEGLELRAIGCDETALASHLRRARIKRTCGRTTCARLGVANADQGCAWLAFRFSRADFQATPEFCRDIKRARRARFSFGVAIESGTGICGAGSFGAVPFHIPTKVMVPGGDHHARVRNESGAFAPTETHNRIEATSSLAGKCLPIPR